jgi:integrin alpha FG-GAP repeat containing protein 1
MDIVFPVCGRRTSSAGTGSDCAINIAYNKQIPICTGLNAEASNNGGDTSLGLKCRGWSELCTADPDYRFDFEEGNEVGPLSISGIFQGPLMSGTESTVDPAIFALSRSIAGYIATRPRLPAYPLGHQTW